jgi:hypothetical protein
MESQKRQADTPEGNIAPHCKQVLVTGCFCAADASTPVKEGTPSEYHAGIMAAKKVMPVWRIRQREMM